MRINTFMSYYINIENLNYQSLILIIEPLVYLYALIYFLIFYFPHIIVHKSHTLCIILSPTYNILMRNYCKLYLRKYFFLLNSCC